MSGFDTKAYERDPALQHPHSVSTKTVPILWKEVYRTHRARRDGPVAEWLKQTFQSWKSVFRRPVRLIPERGNRLQAR